MGCGIQVLADWLTLTIGVWIYKHIDLTYFNQALCILFIHILDIIYTSHLVSYPSPLSLEWLFFLGLFESLDLLWMASYPAKARRKLTQDSQSTVTLLILSMWSLLGFCCLCEGSWILHSVLPAVVIDSFLFCSVNALSWLLYPWQSKKKNEKKKDQQKQGKSNK